MRTRTSLSDGATSDGVGPQGPGGRSSAISVNDKVYAALGVVMALLALIVLAAIRRWWRSWRARRGGRHAHRREAAARAVLQRAGFTVIGEQVRHMWSITCGEKSLPIELRADYLVERGDRRFVADVKTGPRATRITTAATRRQLLEYRVAYDVSGVLLVDMDNERIHEVGFGRLPSSPS